MVVHYVVSQSYESFPAFGWHLVVFASLAGVSAALVFLLWYPGLLAYASGVRNIFLLLLLVDVTLGPVITLIIFNPRKKELKRDLAVVVIVQLAALLYGLHTVFKSPSARLLTIIGRPGVQVAVVTRRPQAYCLHTSKAMLIQW